MGLMTLDEAKEHLNPPGDIDDNKIERQIIEATVIVLRHCKLPLDSYQSTAGDPNTDVPPDLRAAALLVLGSLYDNADGQSPDKEPLSPAVKALLMPWRKPTLA